MSMAPKDHKEPSSQQPEETSDAEPHPGVPETGVRVVKGGGTGRLRSRTLLASPTEREATASKPGYPDQSEKEYYLPLDHVVETIVSEGATRVGLQFPNGLRDRAPEVAETLEAHTDALIITSGDPCFGACDLADRDLAVMEVDLLVHFGHYEMPHIARHYQIPILFVPVHTALPLLPAAEAALPQLKGKRIALTTVAQHADKLQGVVDYLSQNGVDCRTNRGDARLWNPAQLIGCNYSAATPLDDEVDAYLYLGTGDFHPLGLALTTTKPVIAADPFTREVRELSDTRDKFLRQRWAQIARARDAQTFGILVSTKSGQTRTAQALFVKKQLEDAGYQAHLIALRDVTPEILIPFRHLDAFVIAACPRVGIDDQNRYEHPMLTIQEIKLVLDPTKTDYVFDQIDPVNYVKPQW
jgi:2-(3-amino-3-carboxypropyl)histidine synthase